MNLTLLNDFLAQEMDRKEFLVRLGVIVVALTGIPALLKGLTGIISGEHYPHQTKGFGSGPYGV